MPYESLRDYLSVHESHGLIQWVEKEVDKDWEISSLARQYFRKTSSTNRTALGFRKVKLPAHREMIKFYINDIIVEPVVVLGRMKSGMFLVKFADGAVLPALESDIESTRERAETLCRIYRDDRNARI